MRHIAFALCVFAAAGPAAGQDHAPSTSQIALAAPITARLTVAEQEQFLLDATIEKVKGVNKGITGTQRATLSRGALTHDASIQFVNESRPRFESSRRVEFNFRDYWGYNVAAYRLGVMLGLDMIPPSVLRRFRSQDAAFTWWVDDVVMDEMARVKAKRSAPDPVYWHSQMHILRVFDELIANTDRNQGNMLIDKDWKLWLIDHSRAFRTTETLRSPRTLVRCERTLMARMKALTLESLKAQVDAYLTDHEMTSLLRRRDKIVARIEALGPSALYDLKPPS